VLLELQKPSFSCNQAIMWVDNPPQKYGCKFGTISIPGCKSFEVRMKFQGREDVEVPSFSCHTPTTNKHIV
jgi:hypothetical protein